MDKKYWVITIKLELVLSPVSPGISYQALEELDVFAFLLIICK